MNNETELKFIRKDLFNQSAKPELINKLNCWTKRKEDERGEGIKHKNFKRSGGGSKINPITCLKTLVSKKKERLIMEGYDLDMTYITNYVAALGYPAVGAEVYIRNSREDVKRFFKSRHGTNVKIYNLCIETNKKYSQDTIPDFGY
jgi:hypothetical protein